MFDSSFFRRLVIASKHSKNFENFAVYKLSELLAAYTGNHSGKVSSVENDNICIPLPNICHFRHVKFEFPSCDAD